MPHGATAAATNYRLWPGLLMDLMAPHDSGEYWDLNRSGCGLELQRLQEAEGLELLMSSPLSRVHNSLLWLDGPGKEGEGRDFRAREVCWKQLAQWKHFVLEWPADAEEWQVPEVQALALDARVIAFWSVPPSYPLSELCIML
eukprot:557961-Amphidinium_carterae.1